MNNDYISLQLTYLLPKAADIETTTLHRNHKSIHYKLNFDEFIVDM